jgi:hypothetical protein
MAVATETATTTAGGGGDTTMAAGEGSLTKRPGGTPREYGITIESEFTKRRWILIVDLRHLKFSHA